MTYQEQYNKLREDFAEKSDKLIKAEKKLSETNGFAELGLLGDFSEAKKSFQEAANKYHEFLNYIKQNSIKPDDKFA